MQFSVGEYKTESLSAATGAGTVHAVAGASAYGRGNPALASSATIDGLGTRGGRQQLRSATIANLAADKIDPQATSNQTYVQGPWNSAGAGNIDSKQIAVTAVAVAANPGTGIQRINLGDAQWLQTEGRLQNGADFNVVTRTANTGQRVVAALNTDVDPSWAVGENDDGNTSGSAAAAAQRSIGPGIRFSGKTSGPEARNAIAQSRLGFGALSLSEARGAAGAAPLRTLDVDFNDLTDPTTAGVLDTSKFTHLNYDSIVNFAYKTVLISHYNTVKQARPDLLAAYRSAYQTANGHAPTAVDEVDWWSALTSEQTGIKGDVAGAVRAVITNVTNSTGTAAKGITNATVSNPADGLFINGFLIPQLLNYTRQTDGATPVAQTLDTKQLQLQADVSKYYGGAFTADGTSGSNTQTIGSSATYGALGTSEPVLGAVAITDNNYLFGNFNQDGRRDYASVKSSVAAALALRAVERVGGSPNADSSLFRGAINASPVGYGSVTGLTKGDLIVLGDFNTDGAFDGADVYALARGAALSDSASDDHLAIPAGSTFGDAVRNANAHLNKNAALDYAKDATSNTADADQQFLRRTARATLSGATLPSGATLIASGGGVVTYTFDPNGDNAFNKLDVNRDGKLTREDAGIVDAFVGKNYHAFDDQLAAVVRTDLNPAGSAFAVGGALLDAADPANASITRRHISLVDVELNDDGAISATLALPSSVSDFSIIRDGLGSLLKFGDTNFDGSVTFADLLTLAQNYQSSVDRWSKGDFDLNGTVGFSDLLSIAQNYQGGASLDDAQFAADWALAQSLVPEPTSFATLAALVAPLIGRRRR